MKNVTTRLMIAAAAMVAASSVASAQAMKADVPFQFRVGGAVLEAGTYQVSMDGSGKLRIQTQSGNRTVLAVASSPIESNKPSEAKLVFVCGRGPCTLVQAWSSGDRAYALPYPKQRDAEASLRVIRLREDVGE